MLRHAVNLTEKILARASKRERVSPGDVIFADVDRAMVHDVSGPGVIKVFEKLRKRGIDTSRLWDPSRVWVAEDHFVPSAEKISAQNLVRLSEFVRSHGITKHYRYGMGQYGICHSLSHEEALVLPGEVYVGGDSHTPTRPGPWGRLPAAWGTPTWRTCCSMAGYGSECPRPS